MDKAQNQRHHHTRAADTVAPAPGGRALARRDFLRLGLLGTAMAAGLGGPLFAQSAPDDASGTPVTDPNAFTLARFRFLMNHSAENEWDAGPEGDDNVLALLREATSIKISDQDFHTRAVSIDDFDKIRRQPFLFMTSSDDFTLTPDEAQVLREFFKRGGFIYADDCVDNKREGDFFYQAFLREIRKVTPETAMEAMPPEHEIYHCLFDLPGRAPYCWGQHRPDMGLFLDGRLVCFLTSGDVHCGWFLPFFAGEKQTACLRMGVNIIVYALTH